MPARPSGPRPACPVCREPVAVSIARPPRWLESCGAVECVGELRARKTRGNVYGNRGGGPERKANPTHSAVHARARRIIRGMPCALADDGTCVGRMEAALRADFPRSLLVTDPHYGSLYYPGPNTEDAYRPLCRSHHCREGALIAAAARSPRVAAAAVADRIRADHGDCSPLCGVCGLIAASDEIVSQLVAYEERVMTERARVNH